MDEINLYDDLDEFQEQQEKKSKELQEAEEKYQQSLKIIEELQEEKKKLTKNIHRIELSFQNLLDTARSEIKRKDKEIDRLRKEKDDICFRRKISHKLENSQISNSSDAYNPSNFNTIPHNKFSITKNATINTAHSLNKEQKTDSYKRLRDREDLGDVTNECKRKHNRRDQLDDKYSHVTRNEDRASHGRDNRDTNRHYDKEYTFREDKGRNVNRKTTKSSESTETNSRRSFRSRSRERDKYEYRHRYERNRSRVSEKRENCIKTSSKSETRREAAHKDFKRDGYSNEKISETRSNKSHKRVSKELGQQKTNDFKEKNENKNIQHKNSQTEKVNNQLAPKSNNSNSTVDQTQYSDVMLNENKKVDEQNLTPASMPEQNKLRTPQKVALFDELFGPSPDEHATGTTSFIKSNSLLSNVQAILAKTCQTEVDSSLTTSPGDYTDISSRTTTPKMDIIEVLSSVNNTPDTYTNFNDDKPTPIKFDEEVTNIDKCFIPNQNVEQKTIACVDLTDIVVENDVEFVDIPGLDICSQSTTKNKVNTTYEIPDIVQINHEETYKSQIEDQCEDTPKSILQNVIDITDKIASELAIIETVKPGSILPLNNPYSANNAQDINTKNFELKNSFSKYTQQRNAEEPKETLIKIANEKCETKQTKYEESRLNSYTTKRVEQSDSRTTTGQHSSAILKEPSDFGLTDVSNTFNTDFTVSEVCEVMQNKEQQIYLFVEKLTKSSLSDKLSLTDNELQTIEKDETDTKNIESEESGNVKQTDEESHAAATENFSSADKELKTTGKNVICEIIESEESINNDKECDAIATENLSSANKTTGKNVICKVVQNKEQRISPFVEKLKTSSVSGKLSLTENNLQTFKEDETVTKNIESEQSGNNMQTDKVPDGTATEKLSSADKEFKTTGKNVICEVVQNKEQRTSLLVENVTTSCLSGKLSSTENELQTFEKDETDIKIIELEEFSNHKQNNKKSDARAIENVSLADKKFETTEKNAITIIEIENESIKIAEQSFSRKEIEVTLATSYLPENSLDDTQTICAAKSHFEETNKIIEKKVADQEISKTFVEAYPIPTDEMPKQDCLDLLQSKEQATPFSPGKVSQTHKAFKIIDLDESINNKQSIPEIMSHSDENVVEINSNVENNSSLDVQEKLSNQEVVEAYVKISNPIQSDNSLSDKQCFSEILSHTEETFAELFIKDTLNDATNEESTLVAAESSLCEINNSDGLCKEISNNYQNSNIDRVPYQIEDSNKETPKLQPCETIALNASKEDNTQSMNEGLNSKENKIKSKNIEAKIDSKALESLMLKTTTTEPPDSTCLEATLKSNNKKTEAIIPALHSKENTSSVKREVSKLQIKVSERPTLTSCDSTSTETTEKKLNLNYDRENSIKNEETSLKILRTEAFEVKVSDVVEQTSRNKNIWKTTKIQTDEAPLPVESCEKPYENTDKAIDFDLNIKISTTKNKATKTLVAEPSAIIDLKPKEKLLEFCNLVLDISEKDNRILHKEIPSKETREGTFCMKPKTETYIASTPLKSDLRQSVNLDTVDATDNIKTQNVKESDKQVPEKDAVGEILTESSIEKATEISYSNDIPASDLKPSSKIIKVNVSCTNENMSTDGTTFEINNTELNKSLEAAKCSIKNFENKHNGTRVLQNKNEPDVNVKAVGKSLQTAKRQAVNEKALFIEQNNLDPKSLTIPDEHISAGSKYATTDKTTDMIDTSVKVFENKNNAEILDKSTKELSADGCKETKPNLPQSFTTTNVISTLSNRVHKTLEDIEEALMSYECEATKFSTKSASILHSSEGLQVQKDKGVENNNIQKAKQTSIELYCRTAEHNAAKSINVSDLVKKTDAIRAAKDSNTKILTNDSISSIQNTSSCETRLENTKVMDISSKNSTTKSLPPLLYYNKRYSTSTKSLSPNLANNPQNVSTSNHLLKKRITKQINIEGEIVEVVTEQKTKDLSVMDVHQTAGVEALSNKEHPASVKLNSTLQVLAQPTAVPNNCTEIDENIEGAYLTPEILHVLSETQCKVLSEITRFANINSVLPETNNSHPLLTSNSTTSPLVICTAAPSDPTKICQVTENETNNPTTYLTPDNLRQSKTLTGNNNSGIINSILPEMCNSHPMLRPITTNSLVGSSDGINTTAAPNDPTKICQNIENENITPATCLTSDNLQEVLCETKPQTLAENNSGNLNSVLPETYSSHPVLPSISTTSPMPSNFSGIFSKKSFSNGTTEDDKFKKKSPHFGLKLREFVLPAADVLCNVDNLKNATNTNKKLHWELLKNKNETSEIEDDDDIDTTDEELSKPKLEPLKTVSSLTKQPTHILLPKSSLSETDTQTEDASLLNNYRNSKKSKVHRRKHRRQKITKNVKDMCIVDSFKDNNLIKQVPSSQLLQKRPVGRPKKLDSCCKKTKTQTSAGQRNKRGRKPKIIKENNKPPERVNSKDFILESKLNNSKDKSCEDVENINKEKLNDTESLTAKDDVTLNDQLELELAIESLTKVLNSDNNHEQSNTESLDESERNISEINSIECSMKILSTSVEKLEICDETSTSKDSAKQKKPFNKQAADYKYADDNTKSMIYHKPYSSVDDNNAILAENSTAGSQKLLENTNKQDLTNITYKPPETDSIAKHYEVTLTGKEAQGKQECESQNLSSDKPGFLGKNIVETNMNAAKKEWEAPLSSGDSQKKCLITTNDASEQEKLSPEELSQDFKDQKALKSKSIVKPLFKNTLNTKDKIPKFISLDDIGIKVRPHLFSYRIPKIKKNSEKIDNTWKLETYVELGNEQGKEAAKHITPISLERKDMVDNMHNESNNQLESVLNKPEMQLSPSITINEKANSFKQLKNLASVQSSNQEFAHSNQPQIVEEDINPTSNNIINFDNKTKTGKRKLFSPDLYDKRDIMKDNVEIKCNNSNDDINKQYQNPSKAHELQSVKLRRKSLPFSNSDRNCTKSPNKVEKPRRKSINLHRRILDSSSEEDNDNVARIYTNKLSTEQSKAKVQINEHKSKKALSLRDQVTLNILGKKETKTLSDVRRKPVNIDSSSSSSSNNKRNNKTVTKNEEMKSNNSYNDSEACQIPLDSQCFCDKPKLSDNSTKEKDKNQLTSSKDIKSLKIRRKSIYIDNNASTTAETKEIDIRKSYKTAVNLKHSLGQEGPIDKTSVYDERSKLPVEPLKSTKNNNKDCDKKQVMPKAIKSFKMLKKSINNETSSEHAVLTEKSCSPLVQPNVQQSIRESKKEQFKSIEDTNKSTEISNTSTQNIKDCNDEVCRPTKPISSFKMRKKMMCVERNSLNNKEYEKDSVELNKSKKNSGEIDNKNHKIEPVPDNSLANSVGEPRMSSNQKSTLNSQNFAENVSKTELEKPSEDRRVVTVSNLETDTTTISSGALMQQKVMQKSLKERSKSPYQQQSLEANTSEDLEEQFLNAKHIENTKQSVLVSNSSKSTTSHNSSANERNPLDCNGIDETSLSQSNEVSKTETYSSSTLFKAVNVRKNSENGETSLDDSKDDRISQNNQDKISTTNKDNIKERIEKTGENKPSNSHNKEAALTTSNTYGKSNPDKDESELANKSIVANILKETDSDSSMVLSQQKYIKIRRKSTCQRMIFDSSCDEDEPLAKKPTVIPSQNKTPLTTAIKPKQRKKRVVKVLSTSMESPVNVNINTTQQSASRSSSPTSSSLNHTIFNTDVSTQSIAASMPITPNEQDKQFKEIDSKLHAIFQSPQYTVEYKTSPAGDTSTVALLSSPSNDLKSNVTIDETHDFNRENDQSSINTTHIDETNLTLNETADVPHNDSDVKHLSLGSAEYRFEKVSDNVINLFISRKRKRKHNKLNKKSIAQ